MLCLNNSQLIQKFEDWLVVNMPDFMVTHPNLRLVSLVDTKQSSGSIVIIWKVKALNLNVLFSWTEIKSTLSSPLHEYVVYLHSQESKNIRITSRSLFHLISIRLDLQVCNQTQLCEQIHLQNVFCAQYKTLSNPTLKGLSVQPQKNMPAPLPLYKPHYEASLLFCVYRKPPRVKNNVYWPSTLADGVVPIHAGDQNNFAKTTTFKESYSNVFMTQVIHRYPPMVAVSIHALPVLHELD